MIISQKNFLLLYGRKKIKVKTWHNIFYTNFTKKFSRKVLTNAAPIWYNKRLGGWGGTPEQNFLRILPLFYYTTKKFLFQDLTRQNPENFQKKFLLIRLTSPGVSWYNKRGRRNLFFFFFFFFLFLFYFFLLQYYLYCFLFFLSLFLYIHKISYDHM